MMKETPMAIQIDGLSKEERKLLDIIWNLKSKEELAAFYLKQNYLVRQTLDLLIELLKYAAIDEEVEKAKHTLDACRMLKEIGIDCYGV
jgi:hypothetical protein